MDSQRNSFGQPGFLRGSAPLNQAEREYNLIYAIRLASWKRPEYPIPETSDFTEDGLFDYLTAILPREFQYLDPETLGRIVGIVGKNYGWTDNRLSNLLAVLPCGRNFRPIVSVEDYMGWALNMAVRKKASLAHTVQAYVSLPVLDRSSGLGHLFTRYAHKNDAIGFSADLRKDASRILPKWANRITPIPVTLYFDDDVSHTLALIRYPEFVEISDDI